LFPPAPVRRPRPARIFWYGVVKPFAIAPPPLSAVPAIKSGGCLSASVLASRVQSMLLRSMFWLAAFGFPNVVTYSVFVATSITGVAVMPHLR
jgi:hypothetical protein